MHFLSRLFGKRLSAVVLALCVLCPLFPQDKAAEQASDGGVPDEDLPLFTAEGITVTASLETTQQMKVLTKEDIARHSAEDLASLLQETLNAGVTRYGGYGNQAGINLRGFDSARVAFLIDGVPQNSPVSGEFDLSALDLASVEKIEVIYGGSDTKYNVSGAFGGVINVVTVKKQPPGFRLSGSASNTSALPGAYHTHEGKTGSPRWEDLADTQNVSLSAGYGAEAYSWSAALFANRAQNHFLYTDFVEIPRRKEHNEVYDSGFSASFVRALPGYAKLLASGNAYAAERSIPISGCASVAKGQNDVSAKQSVMLDMPNAFRSDLSAEASLSHSWAATDFDTHGASKSRHVLHSVAAIQRWDWYALNALALKLGGDYRFVTLGSTDMGAHERHDGGAYLTAECRLAEKLLIIPSVKAVFGGTPGSAAVPVPKLGAVWYASDTLTLKNNYFRGFKLPDFEDLYWQGGGMSGNPKLKPEDGWGADLGGSYRYKDAFGTVLAAVDGTVFAQLTTDSIHWSSTHSRWRPENVGKAAFFGCDVAARLPLGSAALSFSYQYLRSYLLSSGYKWTSERRIPYMPAHTVGGSVEIPWNAGSRAAKGSALVSAHYESLRYADTQNNSKLPPYFLLNATLNQNFGEHWTAFAAAHNALNASYESFDGYPMPGITLTVGMRMNFVGLGQKQAAKAA